jgi:O-antigen/teichoic acid export membrane protein
LNIKAINFIKNFSYTLLSNLVAMIISTIIILVVPKLIGVEDYGYWQLYLFYSSYVGILHFGWNDGIYLRYGGREYRELNKSLFFSQFWMLVILQILMAAIIIGVSTYIVIDINRLHIYKMTAVCMLIVNIRYMLIYILQATNRIKEYAQITLMEKLLYCCLILLILFAGVKQYKLLIDVDILAKFLSLIYSTYCCRDIVFKKISIFYLNFRETIENVNVGTKLMFANIASMLIIGIVQFGIERTWDVTTFGKVSLTISVSNLIMVFINAIGIVMFPVLRRTSEEKLPIIYTTMRTFLMVLLIGLLIVYYPIKIILSEWLPHFDDSLLYMALIFPICVYEGKMSLLINTYLKTLRKEKLMLKINLTSVLFSFILTGLFTVLLKSISLVILSLVVSLAFRCILAEFFLSKILNVSIYKDIILELLISLIFIIIGWFMTSLMGATLYLVVYGFYLLIKRKDIKATFKNVNQLVRG